MPFISPHRRDVVSTYFVVITPTQSSTAAPSSDTTITVLRTLTDLGTLTSYTSSPSVSLTSARTATPSTASGLLLATTGYSASANTFSSSTASSTALNTASSTALESRLSSTKSATNASLGLAIGIPIAAVAALALFISVLVYFKKKRGPNYADKVTFDKTIRHSNPKLDPDISSFDRTLTKVESAECPKPTLLNRLSRMVPETPLEFRSPVFLRRFHLSRKEAAIDASGACKGKEYQEKELLKELSKDLPMVVNPYESNRQDSSIREDTSTYSDTPDILEVTKPYVRRLGDELSVCVGDRIKILSLHSDGWATVKLVGTSHAGVIPLMCVRKDRF